MSDNRAAGTQPSASLSSEQVISHLKACQRIALDWSTPLFETFAVKFGDKLQEFADSAKNNQEQDRYYEYQRELASKYEEFSRYFCGYLGEGYIKFKNGELDTHTGEEKFSGDMLSLVENEDLEETIAISSITQRVENQCAEGLWGLNQRLAILNGGNKVHDRSNPLGPVQFCESLRKALKLLDVNTKVKIIAYKVFDQHFICRYEEVLSETNQYLAGAGILPNVRYSAAHAQPQPAPPPMPEVEGFSDDFDTASTFTPARSGAAMAPAQSAPAVSVGQVGAPATAPNSAHLSDPRAALGGVAYGAPQPLQDGVVAAPDPNLPSDQYQGHLVSAIRTLQNHISEQGGAAATATAATTAAGGDQPMQPYSQQQLVSALQNLQAQAVAATQQFQQASDGALAPLPVGAIRSQLAEQLVAEGEGGLDDNDLHTIELVGMLFEYMLSDDNLPDSVKALLSYLHTPFMKIAFIDKNFFEETEHPARLLLNSLAEAGVRWVSNDGTSQYDIYDKIKALVSRVLEEFKNDVRLFAELLLDFSSYTKKIARRQELMERRAMEKAEGEEKLREVKMRVNTEVRSRTDGRELPSAVLLLLLQPWSDYLAFILLRYGDQSDTWQRAVEAIDKLLWSIEPKHEQADRTRQMEEHDELLDVIETGFETIGFDQAKGKKLIDAVLSLQKLALASKQVEAAPKPVRAQLETQAAEKAGHIEEDVQATPEEEKMVENLKMIEFGTWFEFDGGKRLKVAWYNSKTSHYMLVDQMGKKVAMKSGLSLARAMIAKEAKIIAGSSKPFFERALENIFQNLNAQAAGEDSTA